MSFDPETSYLATTSFTYNKEHYAEVSQTESQQVINDHLPVVKTCSLYFTCTAMLVICLHQQNCVLTYSIEVDIGERGQYSNMYAVNLKASFLLVKTSCFIHANVWSSNCCRAFVGMIQCIVLAVEPLPAIHPPRIHLTSFT